MAKYYDIWSCHDDVKRDYADLPDDDNVVYAGYTYEDYSGDALVVYLKDGELYENNDSHCSCYGLECWHPEKTSVEALRMRQGWPGLQEELDKLEGVE